MHLRMFEIARIALERQAGTKVVAGWMSPVSDGYRKKGLVSAEHRLKLCRLASESSKWISVSDFEASKADWTPTVESVTYHAEKAKNEFDADLKLLVGGDTLNGFGVPGLWEASHIKTILSHGMVCICRSGNDPEAIISAHSVLGPLKDRIILVDDKIRNDVSSTVLRELLREKKSIQYLVPDSVAHYLLENDIYTIESETQNENIELAPMTKGYK